MPLLTSIVLAAGRGRRLSSVTGGVPKQFWAPPGRRSLLEETLFRIEPLSDPGRVIAVVDDSHQAYVKKLQERGMAARIVYQPLDRGTATGVLLALSLLSQDEQEGVVLVTPADHGVRRADEFRAGIRDAVAYVTAHPSEVLLLGIQASSPVGDYGWIVPAHPIGRGVAPVASFVEKPPAPVAERLFASGAVWNTMVLVAKTEALLALYRRHAPELAAAFAALGMPCSSARREDLRRLYDHLPSVDFSHDLLAHTAGLQCMTWSSAIGWTDLGTPERLGELARPAATQAGAQLATRSPAPPR